MIDIEFIKHLLKSLPNPNKEGSKHKYFHQFDQSIDTANFLVDAIYIHDETDVVCVSTTEKSSEVIWEFTLERFTQTGIRKGILSGSSLINFTEMSKDKFMEELAIKLGYKPRYKLAVHGPTYTIFKWIPVDTSKENGYWYQESPMYFTKSKAINYAKKHNLTPLENV